MYAQDMADTIEVTQEIGWTEVALHTHNVSVAFEMDAKAPPICKIYTQAGTSCEKHFEFGPFQFRAIGLNPLKICIESENGIVNTITDKTGRLEDALRNANWNGLHQ